MTDARRSVRFPGLWSHAVREMPPDPAGAAGALLRALGEHLGVEVVEYESVGGSALFLLDLRSLGFKGMDLNVVMVSHAPKDEDEAREQASLLLQQRVAVRSIGFCFHILLETAGTAEKIAPLPDAEVVHLHEADLARIFGSEAPTFALFAAIRRQAPMHHLCPFDTTREARGSMFKGRTREIGELTQSHAANHLVMGARLIGKTSLLMQAYERLRVRRHRDGEDQIFYFDCIAWGDYWDCVRRVTNAVDARKESRVSKSKSNIDKVLKRRSQNGKRPLTFIFDEFDRVVEHDSRNDWAFTRMLHEAVSYRWIRVVFAGFRSVAALDTDAQRHDRLGSHSSVPGVSGSPFMGSLKRVDLAPLNAAETADLLFSGLDPLGVAVHDRDRISDAIHAASAGYPHLIQHIGEQLFQKSLKRDPHFIEPGDVDEIARGRALRSYLFKQFRYNTVDRNGPVHDERLLAFLLARHGEAGGWRQEEFMAACRRLDSFAGESPMALIDRIDDALDNLCYSQILRYEEGRYRFVLPVLRQTLIDHYPDLKSLM